MEQTITLEIPTNVKALVIGIEVEYAHYGSITVHESSTRYVLAKLQDELSSVGGKFIRVGGNQFLIVDQESTSKGLITVTSNSGFDIFW